MAKHYRSICRIVKGAALFCLPLAVSYGGAFAPLPQAPWTLSPDSPLTADGSSLYAVAADGKTIVRRPLAGSTKWEPLPHPRNFQKVTGLAAHDSKLYVADGGAAGVFEVSIQTGETRALYQGERLKNPADLAFAWDLYVADPGAGTVFRLDTKGGFESVAVQSGPSSTGAVHMASWGKTVTLASPGEWKIKGLAHTHGTSTQSVQQIPLGSAGSNPRYYKWQGGIDIVPTRDVAAIRSPGSITVFRGVVYVVDQWTNRIYATASHRPRPVRIEWNDAPVRRPTRLLATSDGLFVLDSEKRDVVSWPRFVPADVRFEIATLSEAMVAVYDYLSKRKILPTRSVPLKGNLEKTLRAERVLLAPYIQQLDPLLCSLTPAICSDNHPRTLLKEGEPILVPDLYSETNIDVQKITLDGSRTLGQEVDRRVQSPEFDSWRSEAKLRQLNTQLPDSKEPATLRDLRKGTFFIPVELVRYLAALPADELANPDSALRRLQRRFPGLSIISLEEVLPKAQGNDDQPLPEPWEQLRKAHAELLQVIRFTRQIPLQVPFRPNIGIAEPEIDLGHPDLFDTFVAYGERSSSNPPAPVPRPGPAVFKLRDFEDPDHGTAVAALIAARRTEYAYSGLAAPHASLALVHNREPDIFDDVRDCYLNYDVRLFNLSFHYGTGVDAPSLSRAIDKYENALFVVAAGNDRVTGADVVCKSFQAYPVCWGDRHNVLVVTATTADGRDLLPPSQKNGRTIPGSNCSPKYVHVAAPGEGYYAAGRVNSYVPVHGSSFATPLVTATAALLFAQGVTDPWLIKQRIVATSDPMANLSGKVLGGLINVQRAVSTPSKAALIDDMGNERIVEIVPANTIWIRTDSGDAPLLLSHVRRLTRTPDGYRIVYLHDQTNELVIKDSVTWVPAKPWKFGYYELNDDLTRKGRRLDKDLSEFADFVGPVGPR